MRTVKWLPLVLVLAATSAACGSRHVSSPADVRIVFTQRPPELPFDPEDARLRASQAQLAELLGHPLVFDIDAALLPQWRGSFRYLLVEAIENVARDVRHVKEREPEAFSAQLSKLQRIECRYVATRPSRRSELTPDGSTLRVLTTADDGDLVPRGLVLGHVRRAYETAQKERFGKESAQSVGKSERAAYFDDLTHRYDKGQGSLAESVRADAIRSAIDLDGQTGSGELRTKIRHWLANDAADFFSSAYIHRGAEVKAYGPSSRFRGAERAFATWVDTTQKALPEDDRLALLKHLYPRPFTQDREPGRFTVSFAYPGMHRDAILFDVIDEWIADGHRQPDGRSRSGRPISATPLPVPKELHEWVVCPRPKSFEGPRILGPHCDDTLYDRAQEDPGVAARLSSTLISKKDAILTETVFANLAQSKRVEFAIAQWHRLEDARDDGDARIAAQVMAELAEQEAPELLVAEARARVRSQDRGAGLYLLAVVDRYAKTKVDWASFGKTYGPIRDVDFTQFLATGPHAVTLVPVIWPALETGVKKAAPLVAVYDAFRKAPETARYDMQDPWKAWRTIHGDFCRDGLMNEITVLRGYYTSRQTGDPENGHIYADFLEETSPAKCRYDHEHHVRGKRMDAGYEQLKKKAADEERRRSSDVADPFTRRK